MAELLPIKPQTINQSTSELLNGYLNTTPTRFTWRNDPRGKTI